MLGQNGEVERGERRWHGAVVEEVVDDDVGHQIRTMRERIAGNVHFSVVSEIQLERERW